MLVCKMVYYAGMKGKSISSRHIFITLRINVCVFRYVMREREQERGSDQLLV